MHPLWPTGAPSGAASGASSGVVSGSGTCLALAKNALGGHVAVAFR